MEKKKDNIRTNLSPLFKRGLGRGVISLIAVLSCVTIAITSCDKKDANSPGVEFMPDMYRSPSLETNMTYISNGDTLQANRIPVAGTIARGYMPYMYANDTAGYGNAGRYLHNPFPKTEANLKEGEELYGKFCVHCHGTTGQGDGLVGGKLPGPPPPYNGSALKNLPEGKIFHTITYGKNLMGSHASQVNQEERWKLVMYVQTLQHLGEALAADPITAATAENSPEKKK